MVSIIKGETSIQEAARQHGITVVKKLKQKIGDLVIDIDILKEAAKRHPPMPGTSEL